MEELVGLMYMQKRETSAANPMAEAGKWRHLDSVK
jgi:hypothetical protein